MHWPHDRRRLPIGQRGGICPVSNPHPFFFRVRVREPRHDPAPPCAHQVFVASSLSTKFMRSDTSSPSSVSSSVLVLLSPSVLRTHHAPCRPRRSCAPSCACVQAKRAPYACNLPSNQAGHVGCRLRQLRHVHALAAVLLLQLVAAQLPCSSMVDPAERPPPPSQPGLQCILPAAQA